ncbi:MAG: hypothetical protein H8E36_10420 [Rhodospirillaceae bacterium]|nr:hypothetical protein [Rhodospirillaceae bacterium]MBL6930758.1 hypothetical protein [Rhodospirillales bacterium]MBL6940595.1 hypothetical protein [Rhodospirillales bacterium]
MPKNFASTVIKLAIGSLLLGLLLRFFAVNPRNLLEGLGDTALAIFDTLAGILAWAVEYILIGAIVIVPIWLVIYAWGKFRGK